jgi:hypothetical protein
VIDDLDRLVDDLAALPLLPFPEPDRWWRLRPRPRQAAGDMNQRERNIAHRRIACGPVDGVRAKRANTRMASPTVCASCRRAGRRTAANVIRAIIATDRRAQTAHDLTLGTDPEQLPALVARLLIDRRAHAVQTGRATYRSQQAEARQRQATRVRGIDQHLRRGRE